MMDIKAYEKRVNYYETDQMGVAHHSNYIRWFEEARVDILRQIGLDYKSLEEMDLMLPVLGVSCEYKASAKFDDLIEVSTIVSEFDGFRVNMEYKVKEKLSGKIYATGSSKHCFATKDFKLVKVTKKYPEVYETFCRLKNRE